MAWYDNDDLWLKIEPFLFPEERIVAAEEEVGSILSLVDKEGQLSILDLCCGVGRHSLAFARRGHKVVGVDRTRVYIEKARSIGESQGFTAI